MLFPNLELSILFLVGGCVSLLVWLNQILKSKRTPEPSATTGDEKKQIARLSYQLEALEFRNRTIQTKYSQLRELSIEEDINSELVDKLQIAVDAVKQGTETDDLSDSFEISDCEAELIEAVHGKLNRFPDRTLH